MAASSVQYIIQLYQKSVRKRRGDPIEINWIVRYSCFFFLNKECSRRSFHRFVPRQYLFMIHSFLFDIFRSNGVIFQATIDEYHQANDYLTISIDTIIKRLIVWIVYLGCSTCSTYKLDGQCACKRAHYAPVLVHSSIFLLVLPNETTFKRKCSSRTDPSFSISTMPIFTFDSQRMETTTISFIFQILFKFSHTQYYKWFMLRELLTLEKIDLLIFFYRCSLTQSVSAREIHTEHHNR